MRKIQTLYVRDPDNMRHVIDEVSPGCEWALTEGTPTRKFDGTCVLIRDGIMYARREVKPGKNPPPGFELVEHDTVTGKSVGWVAVNDDPEWKRHHEAYANLDDRTDGTYELVGPKVNGNPEGFSEHTLVRHGRYVFLSPDDQLPEVVGNGEAWTVDPDVPPRTFHELGAWLVANPYEGVVFWRDINDPGCDKCKIKRRDFA